MDEQQSEGQLVDAPEELLPDMPPLPVPAFSLRPVGWRMIPAIGIFNQDGDLIDTMLFEEVTVFFPHGQNVHLAAQAYTERARAEFERRSR